MNRKEQLWTVLFNRLLEGESFDQLNVQDICDQAQIHRSTFYRHFQDKYALLEYGIESLWFSFFEDDTQSILLTPFTTAAAFMEGSVAKKLIIAQQHHSNFLMSLQELSFKAYLTSIQPYFSSEQRTFLPLFIIHTVNFIDDWNQNQLSPLSNSELDTLYLSLVKHLLPLQR